jgi:hypothetical protein
MHRVPRHRLDPAYHSSFRRAGAPRLPFARSTLCPSVAARGSAIILANDTPSARDGYVVACRLKRIFRGLGEGDETAQEPKLIHRDVPLWKLLAEVLRQVDRRAAELLELGEFVRGAPLTSRQRSLLKFRTLNMPGKSPGPRAVPDIQDVELDHRGEGHLLCAPAPCHGAPSGGMHRGAAAASLRSLVHRSVSEGVLNWRGESQWRRRDHMACHGCPWRVSLGLLDGAPCP